MPLSSIRGLEAGEEPFPLGADAIEQALETWFASQPLAQLVGVGRHRVNDRTAIGRSKCRFPDLGGSVFAIRYDAGLRHRVPAIGIGD